MSNLLSQASLVMIPSGYKEDVVYSVIPENGNGDLSFTRASNGTRVNSSGLVEVCPWNLLGYSEDFANAFWGLSGGGTITSNTTTAPNGTLTADTFTWASGTSYLFNGSFNLPIGEFTQSVYAKANASSSIRLEFVTSGFGRGAACIFDLSNGTAGTLTIYGGVSGFTATIESVGNGWYRCSIGGTITIADTYFWELSITSGSIYIWGAQLNIGSTAKPYFPTTDRLNVPRLTYQNGGGGCPSLLLEKQSTNLLSYSQDFSNAFWNKTNVGIGDVAVVTPNYAISPDGTQNASRFVCNLNGGTTASTRSWMIANFTAPATSTLSIWIKLNSAGTKTFVFSDSGGGTKTISGTDWQRIDGTFVSAGGEFRIGLIGGSSSDTLDCSIWGAQAESGSYPTSYIPTTSSSATRVADVCIKTGIGALVGGTSGTVFFDIKTNPVLSSESYKQFCYYFDSVNAQSYMYLSNTNLISTPPNWGSLSWATPFVGNTRYKVALTYAPNDFALYVNGVSVATSSSGTPKNNDRVSIGQFNGSEMCEFVFNQYTHFPSRLTNAELASLTTI